MVTCFLGHSVHYEIVKTNISLHHMNYWQQTQQYRCRCRAKRTVSYEMWLQCCVIGCRLERIGMQTDFGFILSVTVGSWQRPVDQFIRHWIRSAVANQRKMSRTLMKLFIVVHFRTVDNGTARRHRDMNNFGIGSVRGRRLRNSTTYPRKPHYALHLVRLSVCPVPQFNSKTYRVCQKSSPLKLFLEYFHFG